ncbi:serine/threonine protein kinase [Roseiflexus sp. AH-315-K22]|nr:serine/threonine protein kinase [Roseiflexus sp. AH-315-K22]
MDEPEKKTRHWRESLDPDSAARIVARISQSNPETHTESGPAPENGSDMRDDRALPHINGYEIHALLGLGASGRVYLAVRRGSDRPVAIKLYSSRFDAGPHAQRATRELDLLSEIRHPCVVRVLDYGVHDASLWIATEFVDAAALNDYCTQHTLNTKQRVDLLAKVCEAVQGLHEFGVIHRDLKPSNILVDDNGQPTIIDLGIASLMGEGASATLTQEGTPIGTPAFMAPEQARGERAAISTRSDVYSLGAIGYLLLTGDTPHAGDATIHELIRRVAQDEPRDARAIDATIPKDLAAVLGKAVCRSPAGRYASAAQLGADLRRWLAGEHVEAVPPGPWRKASRWIGRHPIAATSAASVLIAATMIGGTSVAIWRLNQIPAEIRILEGGRVAILYAGSGKPLKRWRSTTEDGVRYARLIPSEFTAGRGYVIVTRMHNLEGDPPWSNQVAVWSTADLDTPLWHTTATGPKAPPADLSEETLRDFNKSIESYNAAGLPLIKDVFPDRPGYEITTVQGHAYDPSVIRIHAIDGTVLYEAWHWGAVGSIAWLAENGQIAFTACNNERKWGDRGYELGTNANAWPMVAGSITPRNGERAGWVNPSLASPDAQPKWYKYASPPNDLVGGSFSVRTEVPDDPPGSHARVTMVLPSGAGRSWVLDRHGEIAGGHSNDLYKTLQKTDPDAPLIRVTLKDWPPPDGPNPPPDAEQRDEKP